MDEFDPKGLIAESYRMAGISAAECRSIFLDWALTAPMGQDLREAITLLLERHAKTAPDHPMTRVLQDGLETAEHKGRRGGRRERLKNIAGEPT